MYELGVGKLGMTPFEFWGCTYREFEIKAKAYQERDRQEWQRATQQTAWVINAFRGKGKPAVKVEDFLGSPDKPKRKKKTTEKESKELITDLMDEFGF